MLHKFSRPTYCARILWRNLLYTFLARHALSCILLCARSSACALVSLALSRILLCVCRCASCGAGALVHLALLALTPTLPTPWKQSAPRTGRSDPFKERDLEPPKTRAIFPETGQYSGQILETKSIRSTSHLETNRLPVNTGPTPVKCRKKPVKFPVVKPPQKPIKFL